MSIFFKIPLLLFFPLLLSAQSATEFALTKACNCLGMMITDSIETSLLEQLGDSCITVALWQQMSGLMAEYKLDLADNKAVQKVGANLGQKLAGNCVHYQRYARQLAAEKLLKATPLRERQRGLIINLSTATVPATFTLLDSLGQEHRFAWLREFDGSARFFKGIENYRLVEVEVVWQEAELYDPISKEYKILNEIILLEETKQLTEEERQTLYIAKLPQKPGKKKHKKR